MEINEKQSSSFIPILKKVVLQVLRAIDADEDYRYISHIALLNDNKLRFVAASSDEYLTSLQDSLGDVAINTFESGIGGFVCRTKQTVHMKSSDEAHDYADYDDAIESQLAVPLLTEGNCIGVIMLESDKPSAFTSDDVNYIELISSTAVASIIHHPDWVSEQKPTSQTQEFERVVTDTPSNQKEYLRKLVVDLKRQGVSAHINRIFGEFSDIALSSKPILTFERTFAAVLPQICIEMGAEFGFILKDMGHRVQFQVYDLYSQFDVPIGFDDSYTFDEEDWDALGEGKGVYVGTISQFDYKRTSYLPFDDWIKSQKDKERTEIGIVRIGGHLDAVARYVLVLGRKKSKATRLKNALSFGMQADTFNLIALRLHEIYNVSFHTEAQLQYDRDRQQFIQDVMHQLNSSLGSIKADVENLIDGIVTPKEYPQAFSRLYGLASMFQGYTKTFVLAANNRSILDVYRSAFSSLESKELVRFLERNAEYFIGKAVHVQIDGPQIYADTFADFPPISVHLELFELVIFNLFDNAIKYSYEYVNAPIIVEGRLDGDHVEIIITNHGIELTEADSETIFERFERSEAAINYVGVGTGIGLYLCQEIMTHHNGIIIAKPSHHSRVIDDAHEVTFIIRLPVIQAVED